MSEAKPSGQARPEAAQPDQNEGQDAPRGTSIGIDSEYLGERLLSGGAAPAEVLERQQLTGAQAKRCDRLLDPTAGPSRQLRDQQAGRREVPPVPQGRWAGTSHHQ